MHLAGGHLSKSRSANAVRGVGRDHRMLAANRGCIILTARSGRISPTSRIKLTARRCGPPVRLAGDFVPTPNRPPVGGNDLSSGVSHSLTIFMRLWHFDLRDGSLGLWGKKLRLTGRTAPALEGIMGPPIPRSERCPSLAIHGSTFFGGCPTLFVAVVAHRFGFSQKWNYDVACPGEPFWPSSGVDFIVLQRTIKFCQSIITNSAYLLGDQSCHSFHPCLQSRAGSFLLCP